MIHILAPLRLQGALKKEGGGGGEGSNPLEDHWSDFTQSRSLQGDIGPHMTGVTLHGVTSPEGGWTGGGCITQL